VKPLNGAFVRAANDAYADIALSETRPEELTVELAQLRSAIEAAGTPTAFDAEPSSFRTALLELAERKTP
jgi:hypothetical protein